MRENVGVLGAGSWGTAAASALARSGNRVMLWSRSPELCSAINTEHINTKYLPGYELPPSVTASSDMQEVCRFADVLFLASPSLYLMDTVERLLTCAPFNRTATAEPVGGASSIDSADSAESADTVAGAASSGTGISFPGIGVSSDTHDTYPLIAVLTKGFLPDAKGEPQLILDALEKKLPDVYRDHVVYVAGPSHGEEVAAGKLTGLIAASKNPLNSIRCREMLKSRSLLVYSSLDIVGVQVCAAAKNVIAIAFGLLDALIESSDFFGDNTESLLLAAGLNEIQIIGRAMGATHPETFTSISGIGDLDVTCRSKYGRNRKFGREIITKRLLESFTGIDDLIAHIGNLGYLPEGIVACSYLKKLAAQYDLRLPLCAGLYKILNKEWEPAEFIEEMLSGS